jgi:signal transduction histidine kinase
MGRDITNEKNVERQMILLERMATRGEMAAEIAHELNNYLSIVLGNLELLQMQLDAGKIEKTDKKIESMKTGLDKITRFTDGLMMFSRPASKKEKFDLHTFLENELFFIKPQNRFDNVEFQCDFDPDLPPITADKSQIQQALLNLLNNAADALVSNEKDKYITIKTRYLGDTDSVSMSIIDNGIGLNQDSKDRVFKQHFTTKERGHGFGLLAVKRVIKSHGGSVEADNNPGSGAIFTITFPIRPGENRINSV